MNQCAKLVIEVNQNIDFNDYTFGISQPNGNVPYFWGGELSVVGGVSRWIFQGLVSGNYKWYVKNLSGVIIMTGTKNVDCSLSDVESAVQSAIDSANSATASQNSAILASQKADEASQSAIDSANRATASQESATLASQKADEAKMLGFQGTWNALTNTPTLTNTPNPALLDGSHYDVVVSGTQNITGSATLFEQGDQVKKAGTAWVRVPNSNNKYPFDDSITPNQLLKDSIINVELIGRNPNKQYTIGILRKNYSQSGILKTTIRIYEWVGGTFGSQSCVFQQDNYVPTSNIERIKLTETTTGIYFFVTVDWSKIPDGTSLDTMGYNISGLSPLCIVGYGSSISRSMLDSTILHKNYPFDSTSTPNSVFQSAFKNIRVFSNDMTKLYTLATLKKNASGSGDWGITVYEWANGTFGNYFRFLQNLYVPKYQQETIILTSLTNSDTIEIDIDWSLVSNGYDLASQPFSVAGISNLCYRPTLLKNNKGIVAGLGDSRIDMGDNNPTGTYDPKGAFTNKQNYGLMTWAEILCDRKLTTMGYNFGVSGETSTQILARIESVLLANPNVCVVWAGMNDIAQNVAISTLTANMQKIYEKLLGRGIKVVAVLDNFATNFTSAQHLLNRQLNDWIRAYVEGRENVYLIDADIVVSSPTAETPTAKPEILYDSTHIGVKGAYQLGKQLAEILNRLLPYKRTKSVGARDSYNANTNPNQLFANLGFTGTGGTLGGGTSGTVPTNWVLSRSGTTATVLGSVTTSTEGFPEYTIALTANAAEDKFSFSQNLTTSLMLPNVYYKLECEVEVINPTGLRAIGAWLETNLGGSGGISYTKGCGLDSGQLSAGSLNESFVGHFETPVLLSPATISQVNWFTAGVKGQFNGVGSATIKIRKLKLIKL